MAGLLGAVAGARELLLGDGSPTIDNWTFRLFYQYSTSIFLTSSILVTSHQFFGNPIQCDLPAGGVSDATLKSYCWMYSTFNIPDKFQGNCARRESGDDVIHNTYYQWVSLCLLGQACLFYIPRAVWLSVEGGLMKHLAKDKQGRIIECAEEKCDSLLINYKEHLYNKYNRYFLAFFLCEIFNLAIAAGQFYITDKFLGRSYLSYGSDVYRYYSIPEEERGLYGNHNPMCQTFPRVVSCTYFRYGGGGRQEALQALCIIALNIIIDKVYLVLWIWFVILLIFGSFRIIQRCLQTLSIFRYHLLRLRMHRYFKDSEQCANIQAYVANCSMGDWFVLYQMSKNMNRRLFYMFLNKLAKSGRSPVKNKKDNNLAENLITVQKEEKSDAEKTTQENEEKDKKEEKDEKKADTVEETNERRRKKESSDGEEEPRFFRKLWKESKEDDNKNSSKNNDLLKTKKKS